MRNKKSSKNNLPTLSIVIVTFNNSSTLPFCLKAIKSQDYPKKLIEYINVDGGSTDKTSSLMRKYGFKVIKSRVASAEVQRAIALKKAKNEIVVYIDADNYLPGKNWLLQMAKPFAEDKKIIYSQTLHYAYRRQDSLFNRYCALFGVADPVVYYVGRPDRLSWADDKWKYGKIIKETEEYFVVNFTKENLPTVGCNGIMVKRGVLLNNAKSDPDNFLHIDVFVDLLDKGFNNFAIVKNDVIHSTAITLRNLIKKRVAFLTYYFNQATPRRYKIYDPSKKEDNWKMFLFIFYTVTLFRPLWDSLKGFMKIHDVAWFLHPLACWGFLYAYGKSFIKNKFYNHGK